MLNSVKKNFALLVLSEKKILNETKNHNPPFKLVGPLTCMKVGQKVTIYIYT